MNTLLHWWLISSNKIGCVLFVRALKSLTPLTLRTQITKHCLTHLSCHQDKTAHVEIIFSKGVLSEQLFHILTRSTSTTLPNYKEVVGVTQVTLLQEVEVEVTPSLTTRYSPVLLMRSFWRCKGQSKLKYASLSPGFLKSYLPFLPVIENLRDNSKSFGEWSTHYWAQLKAKEY